MVVASYALVERRANSANRGKYLPEKKENKLGNQPMCKEEKEKDRVVSEPSICTLIKVAHVLCGLSAKVVERKDSRACGITQFQE